MSDLEVFGPLVIATDVEDAVEATLKLWMQTYLERMVRHIGKPAGWLSPPKSYTVSSDFDHFPEEAVPAVLIICPNIDKPLMDGKREYRATFPIKLGIFVEARDRRSSERLAKYYAAALGELLLHKGSLGDFAIATTWEGDEYGTRVSDHSQRTFGSAEIKLAVEVRQVRKRLSGPGAVPPAPQTPPGPWPLVTKKTPVVLKPTL